MIGRELHEHVTIGRPHRCVRPDGERDAVRRKADVVEYESKVARRDGAMNRLLHLGEEHLGLLETRTGRRANVKLELPTVYRREEVFADRWHEQE